jgi:DNA-directed RNA polymerase specialized sigma24 family protein
MNPESLYDQHSSRIFLRKSALSRNDMDDVRQSVAVKFFLTRHDRHCEHEFAYLSKVVRTCVADNRRAARRFPRVVEILPSDTSAAHAVGRSRPCNLQRTDDELDLEYALDRFSHKEGHALRMRLAGWTNRQIAAAENSPEPAIRQRVSRAIVKARAILHA